VVVCYSVWLCSFLSFHGHWCIQLSSSSRGLRSLCSIEVFDYIG
jgi:hypothetical protein